MSSTPLLAAVRHPQQRMQWVSVQGIVYLSLALIPLVAIPLPGATDDARVSFVDLAALPIFVLLLIRGRLARSSVLLFLLAFLFCAWLSILGPDSGLKDALRVYRLCAIYAPFILALSIPWGLPTVERALKVFWWSGLLGIVLGMIVYWLFGAVREDQQRLWLAGSGGSVFRAGGILGNSGGFSHLIAGWAMTAICLRWIAAKRLALAELAITFAVLVYGIAVTASRAALLQSSVAVAFTLFFVARSDRKNVPRLFLIVGSSVFLLAILVPLLVTIFDTGYLNAILARFGLGDGNDILRSGRYAHWSELLRTIDWSPIGSGYKRTTDATGLQVDNSYLRIFLELGAIGLVSFVLMWLAIQTKLLSATIDPVVRRYQAAAAGLAMGELARMFYSDTFTMYLSAPTFMAIVAIVLRLRSDGGAEHAV